MTVAHNRHSTISFGTWATTIHLPRPLSLSLSLYRFSLILSSSLSCVCSKPKGQSTSKQTGLRCAVCVILCMIPGPIHQFLFFHFSPFTITHSASQFACLPACVLPISTLSEKANLRQTSHTLQSAYPILSFA